MKKLSFALLLLLPFFGFAQRSISVEESMQLINNTKKLQIVDVRTPQEFDSTAIQKAVNIDYKNPSQCRFLRLERCGFFPYGCDLGSSHPLYL